MEKPKPKQKPESRFEVSYTKLTKFLKLNPARKKLEKFIKENPGLIVYVPKEKVKAAHAEFEEYMEKHPIEKQIHEEAINMLRGEEKGGT